MTELDGRQHAKKLHVKFQPKVRYVQNIISGMFFQTPLI